MLHSALTVLEQQRNQVTLSLAGKEGVRQGGQKAGCLQKYKTYLWRKNFFGIIVNLIKLPIFATATRKRETLKVW
jgi:hypothetical protein